MLSLIGVGLSIFVLGTLSDFQTSSIKEDMVWTSKLSYDIVNRQYYSMVMSGGLRDRNLERIDQGKALGELEDFGRQKDFSVIVYSEAENRLVLGGGFPIGFIRRIEHQFPESETARVKWAGREYYVYHFGFGPWRWQIFHLKDASQYAGLIVNIRYAQWATGLILVLAAALLYLLLRWNINRPIGQIIHSIEEGGLPVYRGIREFEYLAGGIGRMRKSLEERERFLARVFDSIQDGISIMDTGMRIIRVNPTMERWFRHQMPLVGKKCHLVYHGLGRKCENCPDRGALDEGEIRFRVVPRIGPSGESTGWLEIFVFPLVEPETGKVDGVIEYVRDITERRWAEEMVRKSEEKYRFLADNVTDVIWTMDLDLHWTYLSPSVTLMRGYSVDEMLQMKLEDTLTPESFEIAQKALREEAALEAAGGGDPDRSRTLDLEFLRKDGGTVWGEITTRFLRDKDGKAIGLVGVTRDITERKVAEDALKESEERFRTAFRTSPDSININRLEDGVYIDINEGFTTISGYSREDVLGKSSLEINIWADLEDREKLIEGLRKNGKVENLEAPFRMKNGRIITGLMSAKSFSLGGVPHILSVTRDISELKAAQDRLRASVEEKELLLKEIHHRVKNNLQVISGLLNLQAHHVTDDGARNVYRESQNRVSTMALIHEELYQAADLTHVDLAAYIQNLTSNLFESYVEKQDRVNLILETEHIEMMVDTAIPCGLIINELISNSLKHAFPDGRKGEIRIGFRVLPGGEYELIVSDNGVGLPDGFDVRKTKSMGLQLVVLLIDQLGGSLDVSGEKGTRFSMRFNEYLEAGITMY